MTGDGPPTTPGGELLLYHSEDGKNHVQCRLFERSLWMSQAQIAALFEVAANTVSEHLGNIYSEGELSPEATIRKFRLVRQEGKRKVSRVIEHYSLEAILAVGYRVRSPRGTQFRQWATARLQEFLVKGFTLDDERLKGGGGITDYFDELLERIREIRASEARVYQRIREIFALASDYREGEQETQVFFATMQNKMHFAATAKTAAEIVRGRADAEAPNMGLTSWKGSRVLKRDVGTAKNYLAAEEIDTLNRITVMFLDQAEFRAQRRRDIRTKDWEGFLDRFLGQTELPVLAGAGAISREEAAEWSGEQYEAFEERRRLEAEAEAAAGYLEELKETAETIEKETGKGGSQKSIKRRPDKPSR